MLYIVYWIARMEYIWLNHAALAESLSDGGVWRMTVGGAIFDTPGIFYTNMLYILLMLLPLHIKEHPAYYRICKWLFIVVNTLAFAVNMADSVYYSYTMRRTTWDIFTEFGNDSNIGSIIWVELGRHWYLAVLTLAVAWGMWRLYQSPRIDIVRQSMTRYYTVSVCGLALAAVTVVGAVRGGLVKNWYLYFLGGMLMYAAYRLWRGRSDKTGQMAAYALALCGIAAIAIAPVNGFRHRDLRPIALSNANSRVKYTAEVAPMLNTPFSLLRTIKANAFVNPGYYRDQEEIRHIFTPDHIYSATGDSIANGLTRIAGHPNIVIMILESVGPEYIKAFNAHVIGKDAPGYAPFLDSLARQSVRFRHPMANASKSIDAMPAVLASIPKFATSFILTSAATDTVRGLPAILAEEGYETAFFHGASTGSMGFDAFARCVGFRHYRGREDFEKDSRYGGKNDFDGYWGIWDEPFLQYFATTLSEFKQPFMASVFTVSSHHPFRIPDKYEGVFDKGTLDIHKCIGYTDYALRRFFETARCQPWYDNTVFVITNDHSNMKQHDEYRSDIGYFYGTLMIYDPSGRLSPGERSGVMQQLDIMPTLLGILDYRKPYVAYGADLTKPESGPGWSIDYINNCYLYTRYGYVMQFDGRNIVGLYRQDDCLMADNLADNPETAAISDRMLGELKAIIQSFMMRRAR